MAEVKSSDIKIYGRMYAMTGDGYAVHADQVEGMDDIMNLIYAGL